MKRLIWIILLPLVIVSCTSSKRISFLDIDALEADAVAPVNLADIEARYGRYDGVYLNLERTIEHSGIRERTLYGLGDKWTFSQIYACRYIILNPEADYLTTIELSGHPDNLYIRVTSPEGVSKTYGVDDLVIEENDDGYKQYKFALPQVVKGTTVDFAYDYEINIFPAYASYFMDQEMLLQRSIPIEHIKFSFAYPEWWQIKVKRVSDKRGIPFIENNDIEHKKKILVYEANNVPAIEPEPYSPSFKEVALYAELLITDIAMKGMAYTHPKTWPDLAKLYQKYVMKKANKRSKTLESVVDSLLADKTSKYERVEAIVDYVYENIKTGKSQEAHFEKVLTNKEGSGPDLVGLVQEMLAHAGIESSFLLVHNSEDGYFDRDYISEDQLYIPALRVTIDSLDYVLFPYLEHLPINHTPEIFQGQTALVITENPEGSWFWMVPPGNLDNNTMDEEYNLTIDDAGNIAVRELRTIRGSDAYHLRTEFKDLTEKEIEDEVKNSMTYTDGDITFESYKVENLDAYKEPLIVEINYSIENLVMILPDEVVFQTAGLFSPLSNREYKIEEEHRCNPIKIPYDLQYNKHITIEYPENWTISSDLLNVTFENLFGSLFGEYQKEKGRLSVEQSVKFVKSDFPKDKINALVDLAGNRSLLNVPTIVFKVEPEI
ncbi:MAG: DUF3857 domain-containing protein [Candidatus Zixiibacteriota bacterium]